ENVLENKRAEIPDVREVVHRRTAGIHSHLARRLRNERLFLPAQSVVENNLRHRVHARVAGVENKLPILSEPRESANRAAGSGSVSEQPSRPDNAPGARELLLAARNTANHPEVEELKSK